MKNALIAVAALASLFTQAAAADKCQPGLNHCGKSLPGTYKGYEMVMEQWYYDRNKKQPAKDYENNMYRCVASGAIEYIGLCEFGCKTTPTGEDDECKVKDPGLVSVMAEHECAEKQAILVAKELRV